ncbi:hypothetical protein [Terricaulis sp.]|uniref:hypothetical protein n=1 Tax=Terricaulis sp. TaxID=2768686 RepID=UPI002AC3F21E|nr:hypothetical protein [Terricaulis sp.]MDZ4690249.1 hypothetical protein [Terricaulis sp.]
MAAGVANSCSMSQTRNNHYVPQWYQEGFFEPGQTTLAYLDLDPPKTILKDGSIKLHNSRFTWPTETSGSVIFIRRSSARP